MKPGRRCAGCARIPGDLMTRSEDTRTQGRQELQGDDMRLVVSSAAGIQVFSLAGRRTWTLGRDEACQIVIDDESVSRKHASLVTEPLMLQDLGSHNGTTVGSQKLEARVSVELEVGAAFSMGDATAFVQRAPAEDAEPIAKTNTSNVVIESDSMKALYARLDLVAPSGLNLLILGETGVGKEVLAEAVHQRAERSGPFLALNCGALPESILEGELFGHEKGAFTGAVQSKAGLFETANNGTIFLDELGELPLSTQAKLLRVLESGEILRLGARKATRVDVRFIAATHRDLRAMVAAGTFREDLFYRINGLALTIPPLRKRTADIVPLAKLFIAKSKRPELRLGADAEATMRSYRWPGNIRELRNVIARAAVLCAGSVIGVDDLALDSADTAMAPASEQLPAGTLDESIRAFERKRITAALEAAGGNQTRAAAALGITRHALSYRLKELGIQKSKDEA